MSYGLRSRHVLKLAAKYSEQNATIWQLQRPDNTEEDREHSHLARLVLDNKNLFIIFCTVECNSHETYFFLLQLF